MARERIRTDGAKAEVSGEPGEQMELIPELDMKNATHKTIVRTARAYHRAKAERDETLTTAKEKMDGHKDKLIAAMHEAKIDKFKFKGMKASLVPAKEKVQVKMEDDEDVQVEDGDE